MAHREAFASAAAIARSLLANVAELLERGEGDRAYCLQLCFEQHARLGFLQFILGQGHTASHAHFHEAAGWGLQLLASTGSPQPLQGGIVRLTVGVGGDVSEAARAPHVSGPGTAISILLYEQILLVCIAFASVDARKEAAGAIESRYRTSGEIVSGSWFHELAALKSYLLGDVHSARRSLAHAVRERSERAGIPRLGLLGALFDRNWDVFETSLTEFLQVFKREKSKTPGDPTGAFSLHALAFCRLASEQGYVPSERPYIPMSLLQ